MIFLEILKLNYRRVKVLLVKDTFVTYFVYRRAILVINKIKTLLNYAKRQRKRKDSDRVLFQCVEYQFCSKLERGHSFELEEASKVFALML